MEGESLNYLVCAAKGRKQEKGWGLSSSGSGQSPKMFRSEKVASLQPNSSVKVR